jgi:hypothetical protein
MVNKIMCVFMVALLLSHPACAASDWKYVSGNIDMKTGNAITCGDHVIKLVDVSYGDLVTDTTLLLEILSISGKKEIAVVAAGQSHLFNDDNYKVTFVNFKNKKINVAAYRTLRPVFGIETQTTNSKSKSYTHTTTVTFVCQERTAGDATIKFDCENVKLRGKLSKVNAGTMQVGAERVFKIAYTPSDGAKIIASIEYTDTGGKTYKQCFDVVSNLPVAEEAKEVAATENMVTVKKTTNENAAKKVFIKAIDVAIKRITFTEEQKTQLINIKGALEHSIN